MVMYGKANCRNNQDLWFCILTIYAICVVEDMQIGYIKTDLK